MSAEFRTAYVVHRHIDFQIGNAMTLAVAAFDSEEEAVKAAQMRDGALAKVLSFSMVDPETGKKDGQARDIISTIGVVGISHGVMKVKVKAEDRIVSPDGDNVVPLTAAPRIIQP